MADCNHECSSCATSGGCQEKEQNERAINNTKGVKKVIGVVGGKGGVGKTTTTLNIGAGLIKVGKRVLLIDADPQNHLSRWLGFTPDSKPTLSDLITKKYRERKQIITQILFVRIKLKI